MSEEKKGEEEDEKEKDVENAEDEEDTVKKKPWRHNMRRPRDGDEDGNNKGTDAGIRCTLGSKRRENGSGVLIDSQ